MKIIDVKHDGAIEWGAAMAPFRDAAGALLQAFDRTVQEAFGLAGTWPLLQGAQALRAAFGDIYGSEVDGLARAIGVAPDAVLLGNLAYDLTNAAACSTFVAGGDGPPLHARNLDWAFPGKLLREHTTVVRVLGSPAGRYSMVGWPGLFGALTAIAPGRFSVSVNFVAQTGDQPAHAFARAAKGYWPVPWAVRAALDQCADYSAAIELLGTVRLLSPVLFTVAGIHPGEAVVIERTPDGQVVRPLSRGSVCTTNHYVSAEYREDEPGQWDSEARLARLERETCDSRVRDAEGSFRLLSRPLFLREETQHQVAMSAASGTLFVQIPGRGSWKVET